MARSAKELQAVAVALSVNGRALRDASDAARERSIILKEMSRTARNAAARTLEEFAAAGKRRKDR